MMTPAISVWINSSTENIGVQSTGTTSSFETAARKRARPRNNGCGVAHGKQLRRGARVLDDDLGGFPVLVGAGVVQDQDRWRPVEEEHALGAREGHRRSG